jgi:hypothetical protein
MTAILCISFRLISTPFFYSLAQSIITPAIKCLKVVIPANPGSESRAGPGIQARALDAGSVIPDLIRDRHDGVSLFNCRDNSINTTPIERNAQLGAWVEFHNVV